MANSRMSAIGATMIAALSLLGSTLAYAQTTPAVELISCTPNVSVGTGDTFTTKRGDVVTFSCIVKNKGETAATVLLSGTRSKEIGGKTVLDTSVAAAIEVPAGGDKKIDLPFLAAFENGTYRYELTLQNASDGAPFGRTISFSSVLNGLVAKIKSATLDRPSYAEGQPMTLALSVLLPGGASASSFLLDVVGKDKDGNVCAYAVTSKPIKDAEESDTFALPRKTVCEAAAVGVILKTADGFQTDSRDIALSALAQTSAPAGGAPPAGRAGGITVVLWGALALAGVVAAYELWKHSRAAAPATSNMSV